GDESRIEVLQHRLVEAAARDVDLGKLGFVLGVLSLSRRCGVFHYAEPKLAPVVGHDRDLLRILDRGSHGNLYSLAGGVHYSAIRTWPPVRRGKLRQSPTGVVTE